MDFNYLYISTEGRIGRQSFWIGVIGLIVINIVAGLINYSLFFISYTWLIINFLIQVVLAYPGYALAAKRFQDRNKPGIYGAILVGLSLLYTLLQMLGITGNVQGQNFLGIILSLAVLAVAIWYLIELGFLRGTIGQNDYGADPVETG